MSSKGEQKKKEMCLFENSSEQEMPWSKKKERIVKYFTRK